MRLMPVPRSTCSQIPGVILSKVTDEPPPKVAMCRCTAGNRVQVVNQAVRVNAAKGTTTDENASTNSK